MRGYTPQSAYAYLAPTPEVWELWKDAKVLGPEYLLSPDGQAELKTETSLSNMRLHVLFALASSETLNRIPNCSWLNKEASLLRQLSQQVLISLTTSLPPPLSTSTPPSPSQPPGSSAAPSSSSSDSQPPSPLDNTSSLEFAAFHPDTNLLRDEFSTRYQHGYTHLPHINKIGDKPRVCVESLEQFQWNFQVFTQGLLNGASSALVSGSTVLACMYMGAEKECYEYEVQFREAFATLALPRDMRTLVAAYAFHPDPLMPYSPRLYAALFRYYHLEEWQACDIDVFLQVRDVAEAEAALQSITEGYKACLPPTDEVGGIDFGVIRTQTCVTLCSRWPFRNVQIVLLLFPTVSGLLSCFDLDCVRLAYNLQSRVVTTLPQAARAISTSVNMLTPSLCLAWSRSTPVRISKYRARGFHTVLFDLWPLERTLIDWLDLDVDPSTITAGRSVPFNPSSILMPSLSYPVSSLFLPGQKLRSPSKFLPQSSPQSRGSRFSFSSTGSWGGNNLPARRRSSCGSEDSSMSFHVADSPCPSPPLNPLPPSVLFGTPRSSPRRSPRRSPPASVYGSPNFYPPSTPQSPYHPFRPPIFNLAFPPRFSPPLTPPQGYPYAHPSGMPQLYHHPPFVYPPPSPFTSPLNAEQVSPQTPTCSALSPPLRFVDSTPPSAADATDAALPQAASPSEPRSVASLSPINASQTNTDINGSGTGDKGDTSNSSNSCLTTALDALTIGGSPDPLRPATALNEQPEADLKSSGNTTDTSKDDSHVAGNETKGNDTTVSPSGVPKPGVPLTVEANSPLHLNSRGSLTDRSSFDTESKSPMFMEMYQPKVNVKDLTMGDRCLMLSAALRDMFPVQLHRSVFFRTTVVERCLRLPENFKFQDPQSLELPGYYSGGWNSELENLPYGPGHNTAYSIPGYVERMREMLIPVMSSSNLEGVWNDIPQPPTSPEVSPLLWFRWKASEFDADLVKAALAKNI